MDIGSLSTALASSKVNSQIGVAMLGKTLDAQKIEGAGIVQMINASSVSAAEMERSVNPGIGANFDMSV